MRFGGGGFSGRAWGGSAPKASASRTPVHASGDCRGSFVKSALGRRPAIEWKNGGVELRQFAGQPKRGQLGGVQMLEAEFRVTGAGPQGQTTAAGTR